MDCLASLVAFTSGSFALSPPSASSAAICSPESTSSCSLSPALSSVTSSARTHAADFDVERLLVGKVRVVRLNGGNHFVDGPALERVHSRGPGPVDVAKLRIARVHVERAPVLEPERDPAVPHPITSAV